MRKTVLNIWILVIRICLGFRYSYFEFVEGFCLRLLLLYRKIRHGDSFRLIKLTQNKYAIVDVADFDELNKFGWYAQKFSSGFYARRTIYVHGRAIAIHMHRVIMQPPPGFVVDHHKGNGLDNRRANLRIATPAQNCYNNKKTTRRTCTSKYKGVSLERETKKWRACIIHNGKKTSLGSYANEIDAARAYDEAAKELFGKFAKLNFDS